MRVWILYLLFLSCGVDNLEINVFAINYHKFRIRIFDGGIIATEGT